MIEYLAFGVFAVCVVGAVLLSLVGMSGPWIVVLGAVLFDVLTWSQRISLFTLALLAGLGFVGELIEGIVLLIQLRKSSEQGKEGLLLGAWLGSSLMKLFPLGKLGGFVGGGFAGLFLGEWAFSRNAQEAWGRAKRVVFRKLVVNLVKTLLVFLEAYLVIRQLV